MKSYLVRPPLGLKGSIVLLGDKSIAHRAIIVSAITPGKTEIRNFPTSKDCQQTIQVFKDLGIKIRQVSPNRVTVFGKGLCGLKKPARPLFLGESGTTLRLILGVLAGQNFSVKLTAAKSLTQRPMLRVTGPLRLMGAKINSKFKIKNAKIREEYPPVIIRGGNLKPITYKMPVASAQVKSALLLAGLYAQGKTQVIEPVRTRDHTERILRLFKAEIKLKENKIVIKGSKKLISPGRIYIPGDISSASFFMVAAAILSNSKITIRNVSLNPSRTSVIKVLKKMGADLSIAYSLQLTAKFEPIGDITIKSSALKGTIVRKEEIPSLIDELPILMVAACFAKGKTIFEGVGELRVKETDRIRSMSKNLKEMGAEIWVLKTGKTENIVVNGVKGLQGARVKSFGDHRTAMSLVIAGLRAAGNTLIDDISCISKSFPNFLAVLRRLMR